jgi:hypothetical protein
MLGLRQGSLQQQHPGSSSSSSSSSSSRLPSLPELSSSSGAVMRARQQSPAPTIPSCRPAALMMMVQRLL